jgi:hypothetical protein
MKKMDSLCTEILTCSTCFKSHITEALAHYRQGLMKKLDSECYIASVVSLFLQSNSRETITIHGKDGSWGIYANSSVDHFAHVETRL